MSKISVQDITKRLLEYNLWANERLISYLTEIDRKTLYEFTGSSFGTIDKTIQHLLSAELYWYAIIFSGTINDFNQPDRQHLADQVMIDLLASSRRLVNDLSRFTENELVSLIQASDSRQSRYEYIFHLVNHASYHRGQIISMCRALHITGELPVTDYDAYLWWLENK